MPFDPSKPVEVVDEPAAPKFDPSKPHEVVEAAPATKPSFLDDVKARIVGTVKATVEPFSDLSLPTSLSDAAARVRQNAPGVARAAVQPFVDLGKAAAEANDFAARAITQPGQTFGDGKAGAVVREAMRGVNSNIPFANLAVEHAGGPPEVSKEDAAAAPGAQAFGGIAGAPVAGMEGAIAARVAGAGAGVAGRALRKAGAAAEERTVSRAIDHLETRTTAKTRKGLEKGGVEELVREEPAVRKAAGHDDKLAKQTQKVKDKASADLDEIYKAAGQDVDLAVPVMNMDARIAELKAGTVEQRAVAKQLQTIRDEFNDSLGARETVDPRALRNEQTAYQRAGYAKNIAGDPDVSARIAANREASKAVGDAVLKHVLGMDYEAARAAAAKDSTGLAARLLKANERFSAANRIEAAIEDRARRAPKKHGLAGKLLDEAKEIKHSPMGWAASKAPVAAAGALDAADAALTNVAPRAAAAVESAGEGVTNLAPAAAVPRPSPSDVLEQLVARADGGDEVAAAKLDAVSKAPIVAARVSAIRRKLSGAP